MYLFIARRRYICGASCRNNNFQSISLRQFLTLTYPQVSRVWWEGAKKTISRRRKEGRVEKKSVHSAPAGPGARTRDLPRARRGSPAARHGGCLDKQAFPPPGPGSNPDLPRARRRVTSCTPWGLFRQASLSVPIGKVGRLRNTTCCVFWR